MKTGKSNRGRRFQARAVAHSSLILFLMAALAPLRARGSENGASVYPVGVETVLPGMSPPPGVTMLDEFNTTYQARRLVGPNGQTLVPGLRLDAYAFAPKLVQTGGCTCLGEIW